MSERVTTDGFLNLHPSQGSDNNIWQKITNIFESYGISASITQNANDDIQLDWHCSMHYDDSFLDAMQEITPYIIKGQIGFCNKDWDIWMFIKEKNDDKWTRHDAVRFFPCDLPKCENNLCAYSKNGRCYAEIVTEEKNVHVEKLYMNCNHYTYAGWR